MLIQVCGGVSEGRIMERGVLAGEAYYSRCRPSQFYFDEWLLTE